MRVLTYLPAWCHNFDQGLWIIYKCVKRNSSPNYTQTNTCDKLKLNGCIYIYTYLCVCVCVAYLCHCCNNKSHTFNSGTDKESSIINAYLQLTNKNQLDATYYFILLLIASICYGHYYAHHQELVTMMLITTLGVSFLVCYMLDIMCGNHNSWW